VFGSGSVFDWGWSSGNGLGAPVSVVFTARMLALWPAGSMSSSKKAALVAIVINIAAAVDLNDKEAEAHFGCAPFGQRYRELRPGLARWRAERLSTSLQASFAENRS